MLTEIWSQKTISSAELRDVRKTYGSLLQLTNPHNEEIGPYITQGKIKSCLCNIKREFEVKFGR